MTKVCDKQEFIKMQTGSGFCAAACNRSIEPETGWIREG